MTLACALKLTPRQSRAAFGAVRTVVEADGAPRDRGSHLLEIAAATLEVGADWRALPTVNATEIMAAIPAVSGRRTLVDALLVPACIEGAVTAAGEAQVRALAKALGVRSHWVNLLGALRHRRVLAVKRQLFSRSPDARRIFARIWAEEGLVGIWRAVRFVLGIYVDPQLSARFRALGVLPQGSLGRTFFDEFVARGLAFPGEPRGLPERMLHHDLMHIVNGYGTDAAGECELAGFYAGFCPGDSFTFIVTVLTTFHLGMPVSPAAVTPVHGAFEPARVIAAFLRGRQLRVDVMGPWDYWELMPLPIAEVRQHLGIADSPGV